MNNSRPYFPHFFIPGPRLPPSLIQGLNTVPIADNPLYGVQPMGQALAGSPFGDYGIRLLQRMRELTNQILSPDIIQFSAASQVSVSGEDDSPSKGIGGDAISVSEGSYSQFRIDDSHASPLPHLLLAPLIHAAKIYTTVLSTFLRSKPSTTSPRIHLHHSKTNGTSIH